MQYLRNASCNSLLSQQQISHIRRSNATPELQNILNINLNIKSNFANDEKKSKDLSKIRSLSFHNMLIKYSNHNSKKYESQI